jgi:hypothetical protein
MMTGVALQRRAICPLLAHPGPLCTSPKDTACACGTKGAKQSNLIPNQQPNSLQEALIHVAWTPSFPP